MSLTTTLPLARKRGDNKAFVFTIDLNGLDMDITGATFLMTVNVDADPTDPPATPDEFQLTGSITGAPVDGRVTFAPTTANMDLAPDTYFYDAQMILAAETVTFAEGPLVITQDITK